MPRNNMPDNWQPPAPAWQAKWEGDDNFVVGYFGIQATDVTPLSTWAEPAFTGEYAPLHVERGSFIDQEQVQTHLYIAYWRAVDYQSWWQLAQHHSWWKSDEREHEDSGYFREIISMPRENFETLNSSMEPHGISTTADELEGPIDEHGYDGGMRDRIPLSDNSLLKKTLKDGIRPNYQTSALGKRVLVIPPENMCVIRSGQNWSNCDEDQRAAYLTNVHPTLKKGMTFLQRNPEKTSCFSMRFAENKTANWQATEQSFGLGYATDIYAFEEWAKSHPTHIAILEKFMGMVGQFGENLQLKLWHEVIVLPDNGCEFEYIGCHDKTGLLNYC